MIPEFSTLNKGSPSATVSDITNISPRFVPVNTTSPEEETFNARFVALAVNNIAEAVSTVLFDPRAFSAYDAVKALNA